MAEEKKDKTTEDPRGKNVKKALRYYGIFILCIIIIGPLIASIVAVFVPNYCFPNSSSIFEFFDTRDNNTSNLIRTTQIVRADGNYSGTNDPAEYGKWVATSVYINEGDKISLNRGSNYVQLSQSYGVIGQSTNDPPTDPFIILRFTDETWGNLLSQLSVTTKVDALNMLITMSNDELNNQIQTSARKSYINQYLRFSNKPTSEVDFFWAALEQKYQITDQNQIFKNIARDIARKIVFNNFKQEKNIAIGDSTDEQTWQLIYELYQTTDQEAIWNLMESEDESYNDSYYKTKLDLEGYDNSQLKTLLNAVKIQIQQSSSPSSSSFANSGKGDVYLAYPPDDGGKFIYTTIVDKTTNQPMYFTGGTSVFVEVSPDYDSKWTWSNYWFWRYLDCKPGPCRTNRGPYYNLSPYADAPGTYYSDHGGKIFFDEWFDATCAPFSDPNDPKGRWRNSQSSRRVSTSHDTCWNKYGFGLYGVLTNNGQPDIKDTSENPLPKPDVIKSFYNRELYSSTSWVLPNSGFLKFYIKDDTIPLSIGSTIIVQELEQSLSEMISTYETNRDSTLPNEYQKLNFYSDQLLEDAKKINPSLLNFELDGTYYNLKDKDPASWFPTQTDECADSYQPTLPLTTENQQNYCDNNQNLFTAIDQYSEQNLTFSGDKGKITELKDNFTQSCLEAKRLTKQTICQKQMILEQREQINYLGSNRLEGRKYTGSLKFFIKGVGENVPCLYAVKAAILDPFDCSGDPDECLNDAVPFDNDLISDVSGTLYLKIVDSTATYTDNTGVCNVDISQLSSVKTFSYYVQKTIDLIKSHIETASRLFYSNLTCTINNDDPRSETTRTPNCINLLNTINAILTIYIALYAIMFMMGLIEITAQDALIRLFKIAIVITIAQPRSFDFFYNNMFSFFFDGIVFVMNAANQGFNSISNNPFAFADYIMGVFTLHWVTWIKIIALIFSGGVFYGFTLLYSIIMLFYVFGRAVTIYAMAFIGLGLLLAIAPIIAVFILFEKTKPIFDKWLIYFFKFTFEPIILLVGLLILNSMLELLLGPLFNFNICNRCLISMSLPFPILDKYLGQIFCIAFPQPWSYTLFTPGYKLVSLSLIPQLIMVVIVINAMKEYLETASTITTAITSTFMAPNLSGTVSRDDLIHRADGTRQEKPAFHDLKKILGIDTNSQEKLLENRNKEIIEEATRLGKEHKKDQEPKPEVNRVKTPDQPDPKDKPTNPGEQKTEPNPTPPDPKTEPNTPRDQEATELKRSELKEFVNKETKEKISEIELAAEKNKTDVLNRYESKDKIMEKVDIFEEGSIDKAAKELKEAEIKDNIIEKIEQKAKEQITQVLERSNVIKKEIEEGKFDNTKLTSERNAIVESYHDKLQEVNTEIKRNEETITRAIESIEKGLEARKESIEEREKSGISMSEQEKEENQTRKEFIDQTLARLEETKNKPEEAAKIALELETIAYDGGVIKASTAESIEKGLEEQKQSIEELEKSGSISEQEKEENQTRKEFIDQTLARLKETKNKPEEVAKIAENLKEKGYDQGIFIIRPAKLGEKGTITTNIGLTNAKESITTIKEAKEGNEALVEKKKQLKEERSIKISNYDQEPGSEQRSVEGALRNRIRGMREEDD